jgi:hypothetical protein
MPLKFQRNYNRPRFPWIKQTAQLLLLQIGYILRLAAIVVNK